MRRCDLVVAILVAVVAAVSAYGNEPKQVLFLAQSPDGHPPQTHEYLPGLEQLAELLAGDDRVAVRIVNADEPWTDGPKLLAGVDGAVLFLSEGARWCQADPRRYEALTRLAARGGGLVGIHWAIGTKSAEPIEPFLKLLGGCHGGPDRKYKVVDTELHVVDPSHPITKGLNDFRVRDEFYYELKLFTPREAIRPILQATIDGRPQTVCWAFERPDGGRSFGFSGLHFHDNWERPQYRTLLSQAVLWTLHLPVER